MQLSYLLPKARVMYLYNSGILSFPIYLLHWLWLPPLVSQYHQWSALVPHFSLLKSIFSFSHALGISLPLFLLVSELLPISPLSTYHFLPGQLMMFSTLSLSRVLLYHALPRTHIENPYRWLRFCPLPDYRPR